MSARWEDQIKADQTTSAVYKACNELAWEARDKELAEKMSGDLGVLKKSKLLLDSTIAILEKKQKPLQAAE